MKVLVVVVQVSDMWPNSIQVYKDLLLFIFACTMPLKKKSRIKVYEVIKLKN